MTRIAIALCLMLAAQPVTPATGATALTGFPFTDETLTYNLSGAGGISLGQARLTAKHGASGWGFELNVDAGIAGFVVKDLYSSHTNSDFCSTDFSRQFQHGSRKGHEREVIDRSQETATRTSVEGGGGKSEFAVSDCIKDALTMLYFTRRELGQGRVPPAQQVLFGGLYDVRLSYGGAQTIQSGGQATVTDKIVCDVKGPASTLEFEIYFARDAARTPLLVKAPLAAGALSLELVR